MTIAEQYAAYVRENCGAPDGGTSSSYRKAIEKLCVVFSHDKPTWAPVADVWSLSDPAVIMSLYDKVKVAQDQYIKTGTGIFMPYAGRGDSYYRKRWCSAALKFYAQFRAELAFDARLATVLGSTTSGMTVAKAANRIISTKNIAGFMPDDIDVKSKEGKEIVRSVKQRVGQSQFRKWILSIYQNRCCVTGLDVPDLLRASHIVAWSEDAENRMNPANGLCLSATYDAAFDRHLISFDGDLRMVLSKSLKDCCTKEVHKTYFIAYEGKKLALPVQFAPDKALMEKHLACLVS